MTTVNKVNQVFELAKHLAEKYQSDINLSDKQMYLDDNELFVGNKVKNVELYLNEAEFESEEDVNFALDTLTDISVYMSMNS